MVLTLFKYYWPALLAAALAGIVLLWTGQPEWTLLMLLVPVTIALLISLGREKRVTSKITSEYNNITENAGKEMARIFDRLSNLNNEQMQGARTETLQVKHLLSDAIEKLHTSFNGLNSDAQKQDDVLLTLIERMTQNKLYHHHIYTCTQVR